MLQSEKQTGAIWLILLDHDPLIKGRHTSEATHTSSSSCTTLGNYSFFSEVYLFPFRQGTDNGSDSLRSAPRDWTQNKHDPRSVVSSPTSADENSELFISHFGVALISMCQKCVIENSDSPSRSPVNIWQEMGKGPLTVVWKRAPTAVHTRQVVSAQTASSIGNSQQGSHRARLVPDSRHSPLAIALYAL